MYRQKPLISGIFALMFVQVSEKIQSVQEGERTPATPPPWGYHGNMVQSQDSIENPGSAQESPATSQPTSPNHSAANILNPPGSQPNATDPQGIASSDPTSQGAGLDPQPSTISLEPESSADFLKPKSDPKPARKKKEKVVDLDNSQEILVVHKKVKKKKKHTGNGFIEFCHNYHVIMGKKKLLVKSTSLSELLILK